MQRVVLPEGISYGKTKERFRTAPLSYLFCLFYRFPLEESVLVAGPRIELGSGGYEPPEVPLLYPAMYLILLPPAEQELCHSLEERWFFRFWSWFRLFFFQSLINSLFNKPVDFLLGHFNNFV